ncbi:MAG: anaerobic glycerol-3-phosphate dehydrogenase subunit A, partial [Muribaculaceae bacterium]
VVGVKLYNHKSKEEVSYFANITVNAGGIWGHHIAELAGININMFPSRGALLVFGHRVNNMVLNRCRKPADADILVPGDTICVIGTTSSRVPYDEIDDMRVTKEEVDILLREGNKLSPALASTRILRAYAGVRPLVAADNDPSGRSISRGIVLLDHAKRDGLDGFITITGGKLMTYRLMAEWTTNLVCKKLNIEKACQTADIALPGTTLEDEKDKEEVTKRHFLIGNTASKSAEYRHGSLSDKIPTGDRYDDSLVCECEGVSVGEVKYAIESLHVESLSNLRRRTRVGMGTCQGELCACRAAGLLNEAHGCATKAKEDLAQFLNERWKGMYPVAWGDTLCETQFTSWIYEGVSGISLSENNK